MWEAVQRIQQERPLVADEVREIGCYNGARGIWRDAQLQQMSMYLPAGVLPWIWHPYFSYQAVSYQQVPAFAGCADASVKDPAARARARSALLIRMIPAAKTNYIISPYYSRCLCGL